MKIDAALLEDWLRDYYFTNEIDIGSSGVQSFSMADLRRLTELTAIQLDEIVFDDSRSCGSHELRQAIATRWGNGEPERVMATHGSSEAFFLVMYALLERGDDVVVVDPCYQSLVSIAEAIGCNVKRWPLRASNGFVPDLDALLPLLSMKTRMVIVNFPHNPTGATLTPLQQREMVDLVACTGAYLIWDAAFADLTHYAPPLPDPGLFYDKAISFGTLSKAYGLPGLRVGWALADPDVLKRCVLWRDYTTLALSPLVELVACQAIKHGDVLLSARLRQAQANLARLIRWLGEHRDYVHCTLPYGGVTAFPYFGAIEDIDAFCHMLAQRHSVLLVPGTCFNHQRHVRLGFGGAEDRFITGLERLSKALQQVGRIEHSVALV
jgi:capreomycidine synthase